MKRFPALTSGLLLALTLSILESCGGNGKDKPNAGETSPAGHANEELLVCEKNGKYGFINLHGEWVIEAKYESAYPFLEGISLVVLNGKTMLIDPMEKTVPLPANAAQVSTFLCGLASYTTAEGKTGLIDRKGKVVVKPEYDQAPLPTDGMWMLTKNELYFYTDSSGHIIGEPGFELAFPFSDGMAPVVTKGKYGYVSKTGEWAIKPVYDAAWGFSEGLALVGTGTEKNMKYSFIDKAGKEKFSVPYPMIYPVFDRGITYFGAGDSAAMKYGIMNSQGKVLVEPVYDRVEALLDGLDPKTNAEITYFRTRIGDKYGIARAGGMIEPAFRSIAEFHEGLAAASVMVDGKEKFGYIDTTGKWIVQPTWAGAKNFAFGMAAVSSEPDKWGYADKTGKLVIQPQFDVAYNFLGEIAFVMRGGVTGVINREGKTVIGN